VLSDAVFRFDRAQVKHGDVVQVSLIIVAINSSAHLGRYTLTASNAAGSASASIAVRLVAAASSSSTASYAYQTPGDRHPAAVLQHPATQQSGTVYSRSCLCHEHITNSVTGVSRPPVLDCGTTFHLDSGGRDLLSTLSDNL